MKKILAVIAALIMCFPAAALTGCSSREEELKMYVPGEYIDEELFDEFEEWYLEKTGKRVNVVTPTTFDTVEDIMTAVEHDHADFDLLLPSDYAVERLIKKGLVQKLDKSIIDPAEEGLFVESYLDRARVSDPTLEYSVPYMYGTFGIMYDYSKTGGNVPDSWSAIFTDEYAGKSANKGSMREAMTSAAIWANRAELGALNNETAEFNEKLQKSVYEDFSDAAVDKAIDVLSEMTKYSALWGGEDLKFNMATGMTQVAVALMWSCDAGYVMNTYEDDEGVEHAGNKNLWYVIPKEGGNIYLDSFVISKYAKNPEAANYFLAFLCNKSFDGDPESEDMEESAAVASSYYAGAISPVKAAYDYLYDMYSDEEFRSEMWDEDDLEKYDESYVSAWNEMYMDAMFPSDETLMRCGTMRDYADRDGAITLKWVYAYVA